VRSSEPCGEPGGNRDREAVDPNPRHIRRRAERERLREGVLGTGRIAEYDVEGAARRRSQPLGVEALADAEVTEIRQPEHVRPRGGGEMQEVFGLEGVTLLAEELLHEVRLEPLLEE
jgi:hypothetical protein